MNFIKAAQRCHVRAGIYRAGQIPHVIYAKNHEIPLEDRVPKHDQAQDDWKEYDTVDDCSVRG